MELTEIISRIFSMIFIIILFYFIARTLYLISKDRQMTFQDAAPQAPPEWGLLVVAGAEGSKLPKGSVVHLGDRLTLGRTADNDIVLAEPIISSHHMQFFAHKGRYIIEDLDSTNGSLLNGKPLEQKTYLEVGDVVTLGSTVFRVVSRRGDYA